MREIHGRIVLESAQEMLAHTKVGLLMVDVLNDFYEPEGEAGRSGYDLTRLRQSLEPLRGLLGVVREAALPVFHIQNTVLANGRSDSSAFLRF
jgi:nicotinamidase-related amidase